MEREILPESVSRIDLTRLNEAEIQVLHLLAEGHTAKSIASLTGRSVVSVNERLRQSRRKTGASSSRELARLLKAQDTGDEKIELASNVLAEPRRSGYKMGALVMVTLLFAAAIAAIVHQTPSGPQAAVSQKNPVLNVIGSLETHPLNLAELVRKEQRDPQWAGQVEANLHERFSSLVADGRVRLAKVTCAQTICEVVGKFNESDRRMLSETVQKLQNQEFNAIEGAKHTSIAFGDGFASYWKRS